LSAWRECRISETQRLLWCTKLIYKLVLAQQRFCIVAVKKEGMLESFPPYIHFQQATAAPPAARQKNKKMKRSQRSRLSLKFLANSIQGL
jgi:hypothetical protein